MKSRVLSILLIITLSLFAISAGIAVPILSRTFYKMHVHALHLPETTGWSEAEILGAYDDVMDFLISDGEFGTGVLKWSENGKAHFTDVRILFRLDLFIFGISGCILLILLLISIRIKPYCFAGRGPSFWSGAGVLTAFLIIGGLGATDFDRAFTVFHHIFFPGKTNWLFDPAEDQIIQILPEVFFRNCAILAIALIILLCAVYLLLGKRKKS